MSELRQFVTQLYALPCALSQAPLLKVILLLVLLLSWVTPPAPEPESLAARPRGLRASAAGGRRGGQARTAGRAAAAARGRSLSGATCRRPARCGGALTGRRRTPGPRALQDLLSRVEELQQRSQQVLSEETPRAAALQELLDVSFAFDVALPQLAEVRVRLEQARWLEEVQQARLDPGALTLDAMRRLIDLGVGLAPYAAVERAMARLQELLTVSEHWDDKARSLLRAR